MADDEGDSFAGLHRDTDLVSAPPHPLGELNGAVQRQRITDPHGQRLTATEDHPFRKPLLSESHDELLGIAGRRHALDEHPVERATGLLTKAYGLMAGLDQLALDALGFAGRGKRTELDGKAFAGWGRGTRQDWRAPDGARLERSRRRRHLRRSQRGCRWTGCRSLGDR